METGRGKDRAGNACYFVYSIVFAVVSWNGFPLKYSHFAAKLAKSGNSEVGKKKLADWLFRAELLEMKEFEPCIKAYRNWLQEILSAMGCPWSNGFTGGCIWVRARHQNGVLWCRD